MPFWRTSSWDWIETRAYAVVITRTKQRRRGRYSLSLFPVKRQRDDLQPVLCQKDIGYFFSRLILWSATVNSDDRQCRMMFLKEQDKADRKSNLHKMIFSHLKLSSPEQRQLPNWQRDSGVFSVEKWTLKIQNFRSTFVWGMQNWIDSIEIWHFT